MIDASKLSVRVFADGADMASVRKLAADPLIAGFTTNPTLMRNAGVQDYEAFAHEFLETVSDRPISFEVFSDEFADMERQALKIASWGDNVYVKIPITNTEGVSSLDLVRRLTNAGVQLNITALMTNAQVDATAEALEGGTSAFVSVFAGRIADSGRDPVPILRQAADILKSRPRAELLWASPREVLNLVQAASCGCHIITMVNDLLKKVSCLGKPLEEFSLETVRMFYQDAQSAGYRI